MSLRVPVLLRNSVARRTPLVQTRFVIRRRFATEGPPPPPPPSNKSNAPLFLGLGAAAIAGAVYYFYGSGDSVADKAKELASDARGAAVAVEGKLGLRHSKEDYQKVYDRIADTLELEGYDGKYKTGKFILLTSADGSLAPVLIRLAWHASGTYNKEDGTGGSNYATMRFHPESAHGANNGLNVAREHMEKIKKEFPWISYGDLWTLGGVAAIQESGGPVVPWRPGRIDGFEKHVTPDGRLPDASQAQDHLRAIFYRMGFNDQEIVALSGAHAMGRCHTDRSGFDGPWSFSPVTFSNAYFDLLINKPWQWRKWKGPAQYEDKETKTLMMLPTDMALVKDKTFRKYAELYAKDETKFFEDFSKAFATLLELGVPKAQFAGDAWKMGSD